MAEQELQLPPCPKIGRTVTKAFADHCEREHQRG
jgi:hypothetical protein